MSRLSFLTAYTFRRLVRTQFFGVSSADPDLFSLDIAGAFSDHCSTGSNSK
jgi:hypothetical protein